MQVRDDLPAERDVRSRRVNWKAARQRLEDNPAKWVLMATNVASSVPEQLRKGRNKTFREGLENFEFATRKPPQANYAPRRTDLWGRFTPDGWEYPEVEV